MIAAFAISLSLIYFFSLLRKEVYRDFKTIDAGKEVDHDKGWKRRAWLNLPTIAGLMIGLQPEGNELLFSPFVVIGLLMSMWWISFSGWLALKRKLSFWYVGKTSGTDKKLQNIKQWQHIALKVGSTGIFIILYLIFLFK